MNMKDIKNKQEPKDMKNKPDEKAHKDIKNKPEEMLKISSKGTVPVLQFQDRVLDESLDIISWAMESNHSNLHIYTRPI